MKNWKKGNGNHKWCVRGATIETTNVVLFSMRRHSPICLVLSIRNMGIPYDVRQCTSLRATDRAHFSTNRNALQHLLNATHESFRVRKLWENGCYPTIPPKKNEDNTRKEFYPYRLHKKIRPGQSHQDLPASWDHGGWEPAPAYSPLESKRPVRSFDLGIAK